ncbi:MAG: hypothetical protein R3282_09410, partial [Rhodothermales bacterium]|nr:hypothetical protein [Rhodothermales bacterium]
MYTIIVRRCLVGLVLFVPISRAWSQGEGGLDENLFRKGSLLSMAQSMANLSRASSTDVGLSQITREAWDGSTWQFHSRTNHTYSGRLRTETLEYAWTGIEWAPSVRTTYDGDGMIRTVEEWDPSSQSLSPRFQFSYKFV